MIVTSAKENLFLVPDQVLTKFKYADLSSDTA